MAELDEYIADILARYWLEENLYCGLGALEIGFRLAEQLGETPDPARVREAINKLSQKGAVSTREVQDDVWVYPKQPLLEPRDPLAEGQVGIYTKQLRLGGSQIELRFFDRQVLDRYRQDPRFRVEEGGASGWLGIPRELYILPDTLDRDRIEILQFGVGYRAGGGRQIVTVILWDLGRLPIEQQQYWASYEIKERCTVDADFVRQSFEAEDTDRVSFFEAFVQDLVEINRLCELMGEPSLFRDTYGGQPPKDFARITNPSLLEYDRFVHLLDKMISDNLDRKFFRGKVELTREEQVAGGKVRKDKGTITLLAEYLTEYRGIPDIDDMLATFRQIRKERQQPAHTVTSDAYDLSAEDKQMGLMAKAYRAVRTLRLLLMHHPRTKAYEPPDWL